jgi:hypothetical protein
MACAPDHFAHIAHVCSNVNFPDGIIISSLSVDYYKGYYKRSSVFCFTEWMSKLSYDLWSVGLSVLVSDHHLGPATNFSFSFMEILFRQLHFLWGILSDEWVCNLQLPLDLTSAIFPWNSWPYHTVSMLTLPQLGGPLFPNVSPVPSLYLSLFHC